MGRHKLIVPCSEVIKILGPPLYITSDEVDRLALINRALAMEVKKAVNTGLLRAVQGCINPRCVGDYEVECVDALVYTIVINDVGREMEGKELLIRALKALGIDYRSRL